MDEFYHGDETEKLLVAAAYRAADSLLRSLKYMLPAVGHELMALLTVDSLWGLCLLAAGWFLTSIVSGPIGIGINVAFLRRDRALRPAGLAAAPPRSARRHRGV